MKDKTKIKKPENQENQEVNILKGQLARALADYDNLRKRTDEEKMSFLKYATNRFIANLLPILDIFEAALTHTKDQGLAIGIAQLKDLLKQEGLEEIRPKTGDKFDENFHEVIDVINGKEEDNNKIAELITSGWKFVDGMVVRHAKVKVFKAQKAS